MSPLALRSPYVLLSSLAVGALCGSWRPLPGRLWEIHGTARFAVIALSAVGWLIVAIATAQVDPWLGLGGRTSGPLRIRGLFRVIRHPTYLGLLVVFWSAETMTWTHLVFSAGVSLYVLLALPWEERDLLATFGDAYADYRRRIPAIVPFLRGIRSTPARRRRGRAATALSTSPSPAASSTSDSKAPSWSAATRSPSSTSEKTRSPDASKSDQARTD